MNPYPDLEHLRWAGKWCFHCANLLLLEWHGEINVNMIIWFHHFFFCIWCDSNRVFSYEVLELGQTFWTSEQLFECIWKNWSNGDFAFWPHLSLNCKFNTVNDCRAGIENFSTCGIFSRSVTFRTIICFPPCKTTWSVWTIFEILKISWRIYQNQNQNCYFFLMNTLFTWNIA